MDDHLLVEATDGVLAIILNRPERRNAITVAMYDALADALTRANEDPSIRIVTIRGNGVDFTAGNDLMDFLSQVRPESIEELPVGRFLHALAVNEVPLIAAVHGHAIGIGTTMLLHCDLVLAEESASFRMPFVELGLVPEAASSLLLPRLAGRRAAARMLLLGEAFGAREALEWGIASHVVPSGELDSALNAVIEKLGNLPPDALRLTQALLRRGDRQEVPDRMALETGHFAERLKSDEIKQAIASFFARKQNA
jgi:enoyl-CoA hydratase/carnithine racemase